MERRFFKAPQKNKQIILSPSGDKIGSLLEENKKIFSQPFKGVRENSRKGLVKEALKFSKNLILILKKKSTLPTNILSRADINRYSFIPGYGLKTSF